MTYHLATIHLLQTTTDRQTEWQTDGWQPYQ